MRLHHLLLSLLAFCVFLAFAQEDAPADDAPAVSASGSADASSDADAATSEWAPVDDRNVDGTTSTDTSDSSSIDTSDSSADTSGSSSAAETSLGGASVDGSLGDTSLDGSLADGASVDGTTSGASSLGVGASVGDTSLSGTTSGDSSSLGFGAGDTSLNGASSGGTSSLDGTSSSGSLINLPAMDNAATSDTTGTDSFYAHTLLRRAPASNAPVVQDNPIGTQYIAMLPDKNDTTVRGAVAINTNANGTGANVQVSISGLPATGGPFSKHCHAITPSCGHELTISPQCTTSTSSRSQA